MSYVASKPGSVCAPELILNAIYRWTHPNLCIHAYNVGLISKNLKSQEKVFEHEKIIPPPLFTTCSFCSRIIREFQRKKSNSLRACLSKDAKHNKNEIFEKILSFPCLTFRRKVWGVYANKANSNCPLRILYLLNSS